MQKFVESNFTNYYIIIDRKKHLFFIDYNHKYIIFIMIYIFTVKRSKLSKKRVDSNREVYKIINDIGPRLGVKSKTD